MAADYDEAAVKAQPQLSCCGRIEQAVISALKNSGTCSEASGKMIPWQIVTLSIGGDVLESCSKV